MDNDLKSYREKCEYGTITALFCNLTNTVALYIGYTLEGRYKCIKYNRTGNLITGYWWEHHTSHSKGDYLTTPQEAFRWLDSQLKLELNRD